MYGVIYIGEVIDNQDPEGRRQVQVKIEGWDGEEWPWCRVAYPFVGQGQGNNKALPIGVDVVIAFEQGRPERGIVLGCLAGLGDVPNAREDEYIAGESTRRFEGNMNRHAGGAVRLSGWRSLEMDFAAGRIARTARRVVDRISGLRDIQAKYEKVKIKASSERTVGGVAEHKFLSDLGMSVAGALKIGALLGLHITTFGVPYVKDLVLEAFATNLDLSAVFPGTPALRLRSPVRDPTGLLDLGTVKMDPVGNVYLLSSVGFVRCGRVATQGQLALNPVATALHPHVGIDSMGGPVAVLPTPPTPPNISTVLLVE